VIRSPASPLHPHCIAVSDIPFDGPVSEVRVARVDGKFVINPMVADIEALPTSRWSLPVPRATS
jgi:hypothetical protein